MTVWYTLPHPTAAKVASDHPAKNKNTSRVIFCCCCAWLDLLGCDVTIQKSCDQLIWYYLIHANTIYKTLSCTVNELQTNTTWLWLEKSLHQSLFVAFWIRTGNTPSAQLAVNNANCADFGSAITFQLRRATQLEARLKDLKIKTPTLQSQALWTWPSILSEPWARSQVLSTEHNKANVAWQTSCTTATASVDQ